VLARYARNQRLAGAVQQRAFSALRGSPGPRLLRRAAGSPTSCTGAWNRHPQQRGYRLEPPQHRRSWQS